MNSGILYIVATPIGNLKDVTARALETLKDVDYILCEDTRDSQKLLSPFGITTKTLSLHQHSPEKRFKEVLGLLENGKNLALITDAGTPGISDPGNLLIDFLIKNNSDLKIVPMPGPSALIAALSISGFSTDKFYFAGFPPLKNKREKFFKELAVIKNTIVLYESTHRILRTLEDIKNNFESNKKIVVCRELTKQFETIYRATVVNIADLLNAGSLKGEFVVVIEN
ncbi:MAG: 16S rRNA (cytidine(1402)-2'-O)-methyltransferase [Candidatus Magasanikbacteria bacterium RIFOXYB2_FULL_38_10]|nr:MAG: 16S rRNA (cytidine(1402)-2'-O)-methyltransferase [Candidatus Magasanikbacteria bacterium RIFOXYB2_FULL_38_10]